MLASFVTREHIIKTSLKVFLTFFVLLSILVLKLEKFHISSNEWLIRAGHLRQRLLHPETFDKILDERILLDPKATSLNLNATAALLGKVESHWQFPLLPSGTAYRGLFLLFHGCHHDPGDFFRLPEETALVRFLLAQGYIVLALGSQDRVGSKCWSGTWPAETNKDLTPIMNAVKEFQREKLGSSTTLPVFAFGASSGGSFVSLLPSALKLEGLVVQISPGHKAAFEPGYPPTVFIGMQRDKRTAGLSLRRKETLVSLGVPVLMLSCPPRPFTSTFLSDAIDQMPPSASREIFYALGGAGFHNCDSSADRCILKKDPRPFMNKLSSMMKDLSQQSGVDLSSFKDHIEEELKVLYGFHELTSEDVNIWEPWLRQQYLANMK